MDTNKFFYRIGVVLISLLSICGIMIGITYYQLQEIENKSYKSKNSNNQKKRDLEIRLEEMLRKMEKEE